MTIKPKIRWWFPNAEVDICEMKSEMLELKNAGYGGVEIAMLSENIDKNIYNPKNSGWGSKKWISLMKELLIYANEIDMKVDFTLTGSWPITIPGLKPNEDETMRELKFSYQQLKEENRENNCIIFEKPQKKDVHGINLKAEYICAVIGQLKNSENVNVSSNIIENSLQNIAREEITITETEIIISNVSKYGLNHIVFVFWMCPTGQTHICSCEPADPYCYTIDHFSIGGIRHLIDFWENNILDNELRELLKLSGECFFEDSLELRADWLFWTKNLCEEFEKRKGYSIKQYLPLLIKEGAHMTLEGFVPATNSFLGETDLAKRVEKDLDMVRNELYIDQHVQPLKEWIHSLGLYYRSQPYDSNMDTGMIAAYSDIPEGESLAFGGSKKPGGEESFDGFRLLSGAAHMTGKNIISDEFGAFFKGAYSTSMKDLLMELNINFTGGVNQIVTHGFAYKNDVTNLAQWPGWSPFSPFNPAGVPVRNIGFADAWGSRHPMWECYSDYMKYVTGVQEILQSGEPIVDILIYRHKFDKHNGPFFRSDVLLKGGYSYEYVSPSILSKYGKMENNRLLGAHYQALLINHESYFDLDAMNSIIRLLDEGLKIIILGTMPNKFYGTDVNQVYDKKIKEGFQIIRNHKNSIFIEEYAQLETYLKKLKIVPGLYNKMSIPIPYICRKKGNDLYYYIFNYSMNKKKISIEFPESNHKNMIEIVPWTSEKVTYENHELELELEGYEAKIFQITSRKMNEPIKKEITYHDEDTIELNEADLVVESWEADEKLSPTMIKKKLPMIHLKELTPWNRIKELVNVSGVGTYTFQIRIHKGYEDYLLQVKTNDCIKIQVNETNIGTINPLLNKMYIGKYLHNGENTIVIKNYTTLKNRLMDVRGRDFEKNDQTDAYGLWDMVKIIPCSLK